MENFVEMEVSPVRSSVPDQLVDGTGTELSTEAVCGGNRLNTLHRVSEALRYAASIPCSLSIINAYKGDEKSC